VAEVLRLHQRDRLARVHGEVHGLSPGVEQGAGIGGPEVSADCAAAGASLPHHPLGHLQHGSRVSWQHGRWSVDPQREVAFAER
jgi:hypothetical protein